MNKRISLFALALSLSGLAEAGVTRQAGTKLNAVQRALQNAARQNAARLEAEAAQASHSVKPVRPTVRQNVAKPYQVKPVSQIIAEQKARTQAASLQKSIPTMPAFQQRYADIKMFSALNSNPNMLNILNLINAIMGDNAMISFSKKGIIVAENIPLLMSINPHTKSVNIISKNDFIFNTIPLNENQVTEVTDLFSCNAAIQEIVKNKKIISALRDTDGTVYAAPFDYALRKSQTDVCLRAKQKKIQQRQQKKKEYEEIAQDLEEMRQQKAALDALEFKLSPEEEMLAEKLQTNRSLLDEVFGSAADKERKAEQKRIDAMDQDERFEKEKQEARQHEYMQKLSRKNQPSYWERIKEAFNRIMYGNGKPIQ